LTRKLHPENPSIHSNLLRKISATCTSAAKSRFAPNCPPAGGGIYMLQINRKTLKKLTGSLPSSAATFSISGLSLVSQEIPSFCIKSFDSKRVLQHAVVNEVIIITFCKTLIMWVLHICDRFSFAGVIHHLTTLIHTLRITLTRAQAMLQLLHSAILFHRQRLR